MGLKLFGAMGSSSAACFPISLTEAVFHCCGTVDCAQQVLNRSCSATTSAGHFLKTKYGADLALDFLITPEISSMVIPSVELLNWVGGRWHPVRGSEGPWLSMVGTGEILKSHLL